MQWKIPDAENSVNPLQKHKPLIDPLIPIVPPDGLINPFVPMSRDESMEALAWMAEQAKTIGKEKCIVDFGFEPPFAKELQNEADNQDKTTILPSVSSQLQRPPVPNVQILDDEPIFEIDQRLKPYSTAMKVMKLVPLLTVGLSLYMYNGTYYQRLTPFEAQRLIVEKCRKDVEQAGTPNHPRAVYDLLLVEPELAQRGFNVNQKVVSFLNGVLQLDTYELKPNKSYLDHDLLYPVSLSWWQSHFAPL